MEKLQKKNQDKKSENDAEIDEYNSPWEEVD
jgi:hypothetical protein